MLSQGAILNPQEDPELVDDPKKHTIPDDQAEVEEDIGGRNLAISHKTKFVPRQ